jgi:hypothetical protein
LSHGKLSPNTNMMAEKGFDFIIFDLKKLQHWTPENSKLISIVFHVYLRRLYYDQ